MKANPAHTLDGGIPSPLNNGRVVSAMAMIRTRQSLLLAGCLLAVASLVAACVSTRVTDGRSRHEQRQIAEACLSMLHSSLTNDVDVRPDDPRVPEVIRALRPIDIQVQGTDVVISRAGTPAEYHFSRRSHDAKPWVLYIAGQGYKDHYELLRLNHD